MQGCFSHGKLKAVSHPPRRKETAMFFRKELLLTRDAQQYQTVTARLMEQSIEYLTLTGPRTNPGRYRGMPFIRQDAATEYRILVRRRDYERAKSLL